LLTAILRLSLPLPLPLLDSGKIDFKEFLLAINITSAGKPEQKLEWAFQMYDVNGDGTIEPKEMTEIIAVRTASLLFTTNVLSN